MLPLIPLAMAGYGIYTSMKGAAEKKKNDELLKKNMANQPLYKPSESSKEMLADARSRMNAVSPGLLAAYQQLQQGAANQMGNAQRNASSGAQALAVGAGAQSQADSALPTLAAAQDSYNQQNLGNYYRALEGMDQQEQLRYQSALGKNSDMTNYYLGLVGAGSATQGQGMQLAASGLASMAGGNYGLGGNARRIMPQTTMQPLTSANMQQMPVGHSQPQYMNNMAFNPAMAQMPRYSPLYSSYLGL